MIACIIDEVLQYNTYILMTKSGRSELILEFLGIDKPKSGDKLLIHESLLDKKSKLFTQPYAFESVDATNLSKIKKENDAEYIILHTNNKNVLLRRIYG